MSRVIQNIISMFLGIGLYTITEWAMVKNTFDTGAIFIIAIIVIVYWLWIISEQKKEEEKYRD